MGNKPVSPSIYDLDVPVGYALLESGDFYKGKLNEARRPCGRGILLLREGHCHVGAFRDGRRHGSGAFVEMREGGCVAVHSGTWAEDAACGCFRSFFFPQQVSVVSEWDDGRVCRVSPPRASAGVYDPRAPLFLRDETLRREEENVSPPPSFSHVLSSHAESARGFYSESASVKARDEGEEKRNAPSPQRDVQETCKSLRVEAETPHAPPAGHLSVDLLAPSQNDQSPRSDAFVDPYAWSTEELCLRLRSFEEKGGKLPPQFVERCHAKSLTGEDKGVRIEEAYSV
ncbi:hypothetical protein BESB_019970 [Besnoitia besnoiti]|uniref:MORN repeat-containing protein n=1 Tax=Besnoitia besnoiti TaxID=94643 RepID=A0A2A9M813_BESBE|nr:hypothetical protein BESB_019970 [Besnoitia besnoiti]PFH32056.1 hypothetical protein BESB_019970 [Besnoitia besnoiti]